MAGSHLPKSGVSAHVVLLPIRPILASLQDISLARTYVLGVGAGVEVGVDDEDIK